MSVIQNLSRRDFLKGTAGTAGVVLGAQVVSHSIIDGARAAATSVAPNAFVSIDDAGTVTITCSRQEMGQGVRTGVPVMLADELEADWDRCKIWQAPGNAEVYDPAGQDAQNTDGSRSTRHHFDIMRELGASARQLLINAAAQKWGVDASEVYAQNHRLHHSASGNSFDFGEVVDVAATLEAPTGVALKDASEWNYIGKDTPGIDLVDMTTGGADYGADMVMPGMKYASVERCPVYRGKVKSYDASAALAIDGVEQVVEIPALADDMAAEFRALGGIAVIATNTWAALEGRKALEIEWDLGPNVTHDSSTYNDKLRQAAADAAHTIRTRGDVDAALAASDKVIEREYFVPYFIHTTMEPLAAIVDATSSPVKVWASTQSPNECRSYVAEALGLKIIDPETGESSSDASAVECQPSLLGGGFGRKSQQDWVCEAAILSKMVGAPVRNQWTREDDIRHGYYHTASAQKVTAGLDANGKVTAWKHSGAWPSILALWVPDQKTGFGIEYGLGLVDMPYDGIPNIQINNGEADAQIRVGWYRSVNNIQHSFAMHCMANELAAEAGRDPLEFMLEMIGENDNLDLSKEGVEEYWNYGDPVDKWPIMPNRLSAVLRLVAEKAGYGKSMPANHGIGLAAHRCFHSYVATAVHVVVADDGSISIPQVDTAIDCGRYVNPQGIRKQIEGAAIYGNTVARTGYISTTNGAVDQSNFHDYPITRISGAPLDVRVHISEEFVNLPPCGVGEPGVPPYTPALVNAIYNATGKRIYNLPIQEEDIAKA